MGGYRQGSLTCIGLQLMEAVCRNRCYTVCIISCPCLNIQGVIISLMCDDVGKLSKLHRVVVAQNCAITCLSWRAWISREARDPTLLVNCAANAVCLFKYEIMIIIKSYS